MKLILAAALAFLTACNPCPPGYTYCPACNACFDSRCLSCCYPGCGGFGTMPSGEPVVVMDGGAVVSLPEASASSCTAVQ